MLEVNSSGRFRLSVYYELCIRTCCRSRSRGWSESIYHIISDESHRRSVCTLYIVQRTRKDWRPRREKIRRRKAQSQRRIWVTSEEINGCGIQFARNFSHINRHSTLITAFCPKKLAPLTFFLIPFFAPSFVLVLFRLNVQVRHSRIIW